MRSGLRPLAADEMRIWDEMRLIRFDGYFPAAQPFSSQSSPCLVLQRTHLYRGQILRGRRTSEWLQLGSIGRSR